MPPKNRDLERRLKRAGFKLDPKRGKGSHRWYEHPKLPGIIVELAGQLGDDAKHYSIREVAEALEVVRTLDLEDRG